jgi:signal transduction histidine kinase/CheY-like chemotaxis protein
LEPDSCNIDGEFFFDRIYPKDLPNVKRTFENAIAGKDVYRSIFRIVRPDGTIRWVQSMGEMIRTEEGVPLRIFGTIQDVTERKEMEEDLRRSRDQLEVRVLERTEEVQKAYDSFLSEMKQRVQAEKQLLQVQKMEAIGTLAGGIAHDFNNMLAAIIGNAELAMDDVTDLAPRRNLEQIITACHRSRDLVKQILAFSRKSEVHRGLMQLSPLVKETIRLLRGSLPSTISVKADIRARADTMIGDPAQIQQVIMNLATNAAQAIGHNPGTITIEVSVTEFTGNRRMPDPDMRPGTYLKLGVSDTGEDIPRRVIKKIFDPFFTTKDAGQGTGLGLSVVFGIVKSHDGGIIVASKKGMGSTFTAFFPLVKAVPEPAEKDSELLRGKEKVLVIDDEPSVLEMISETLRRLGYKVTPATGGTEGWKEFQRHPLYYDLVITDHAMPEITGVRLAEKILGMRPDVPVIICTGYSDMVSPEKVKAVGIKEILMKPLERKELAIVLRRVLGAKNGA